LKQCLSGTLCSITGTYIKAGNTYYNQTIKEYHAYEDEAGN